MNVRRDLASALLGAGLVVPSCSAERGTVPVEASADAVVRPALDDHGIACRVHRRVHRESSVAVGQGLAR